VASAAARAGRDSPPGQRSLRCRWLASVHGFLQLQLSQRLARPALPTPRFVHTESSAPTPPVAVQVRPTRTFVRSPASTRSIPRATTTQTAIAIADYGLHSAVKTAMDVIEKAWTIWSPFGFGS